jgi:putative transferase (TIGR04331 family)
VFLVTTANQKYWKTDEKILFLGEWCKIYSEKHIWSNLDHETLPWCWGKYQEWESHQTYLEEIHEKYLKILALNLNNYHHEDHSLKYWRIIIGPWLSRFTNIIYDRYLSIKSAIDSNRVTNTWIPYPKPERWVPVNTYDVSALGFGSDNFNLYLFGRLIIKLGGIPFKFKEDESFFNPLFSRKNIPSDTASSPLKKSNRDLAAKILKIVPDRFLKIVVCASGLSKWNALKLAFSLGQSPFVSPFIAGCRTPIKENLRKNIKLPEETDEFESILNDLVVEQLPMSTCEGYSAIREKSIEAYPKRVENIFTSYKLHASPDEGFRFWVANQVEKGVKLTLSQHGGGYGLCSLLSVEHELKICDKFFSWGWGAEQTKTLPMASAKLQNLGHNIRSDPNGTILWVISTSERLLISIDNNFTGGNVNGLDFISWKKRLLNIISPEVFKLLMMRFPIGPTGIKQVKNTSSDEKERLADICPSLKLSGEEDSMVEQLRRSRLCIHDYFGTSWLETLSMNFPTIVFWNQNRVHTLTSVQSYLDDLRRVKILHDTPESAAEFINEIYEDPLLWWMSSELQQVKDKFCHLFARTSKNWLKEWKEELLRITED